MSLIAKLSWLILLAIHLAPSLVFFKPSLANRLYGAGAGGDISILLSHRGAFFIVVVTACLFGFFDPASRKLASVVVAISMIGFLWLYAQGGFPEGPLRKIAVIDAAALLPLFIVLWQSWIASASTG